MVGGRGISGGRSEEGERDLGGRGRRLVLEREGDGDERKGRSFDVEARSVRSRSNIGMKRDVEEVSSPRYEVCETAQPTCDSEEPTAEDEAQMGCYNGYEDYELPRRYYWRREGMDSAPKIQDYGYSHEPKPATQTEHQTRLISDDEKSRWQAHERKFPTRDWEEPVGEYGILIEENSDQRKHGPPRRHEQSREDTYTTPETRNSNFSQDPNSPPHLKNQPKSIASSEKTIWQGHYSPSPSQSTERPRPESSVWERRETLDGLYCYYLNTKDGRMTDPQPIPRENSEDEEFDLSKLRITPQSPPVCRKAAPGTTQGADISPALPVEVPYRYKTVQDVRVEKKEPVQVLGSTSTTNSKPSQSSAENPPPSPRSYYRKPSSIEQDLRRSVFIPSMKSQQALPRPPIGVYNNREYAQQYTSKKGSSPNQLSAPKQSLKTRVPPALNSTSTNTSRISELFPPSPRSHYGYAVVHPAIPKAADQPRAPSDPHQPRQINPHHHAQTTPHQKLPPKSHHSLPHSIQPPTLLTNNLSSFEEAYGKQDEKGNYKVPFVNTVTDIDERERRSWAPTNPNQPPSEITSVPIRPRASTRGSGQGMETGTRGRGEVDQEKENRSGGKVRWTGSS